MARQKPPTPGRHRDVREELAELVAVVGVEPWQAESYLRFALELNRSLRQRPVPDFTAETKAVVQKWFERGLSGRLLWLVCAALLRLRFGPDAKGGNHGESREEKA